MPFTPSLVNPALMRPGVRSHETALECGGTTPLSSAAQRGLTGMQQQETALHDGGASPPPKFWPHAPVHQLCDQGAFIVTAGTFRKFNFLNSPARLDLVLETLMSCAHEFGWRLQAWAVMANHYHFVALSGSRPDNLRLLIGKVHMTTSKALNILDSSPGRKIWHQYWESRITFETSYLARLNYVNDNPVRHGAVDRAEDYRWCSAEWFMKTAKSSFLRTVKSFKTDRIRIYDDF
jgi:putative transposase